MEKYYNFLISNLLVGLYFLNKNSCKNKNYKFEVLVFSFNRALQLESLLKSLIFNLKGNIRINILYKTEKHTNELYEVLKKKFIKEKNINFIHQESNFKSSLLKLLKSMDDKYSANKQLLFFVDDQILFRNTNLSSIKNLLKKAPITTLRVGLNTRNSYNLNKKQNIKDYPFVIKNNLLFWKPLFKEDDLSYVFSFDSSTIPFNLFYSFSRYLIYKGPNSIESAMNYGGLTYKLLKLKLASFIKQHAINFVITKVQNETNNRGVFMDTIELDKLFKDNWELKVDLTKIDNFDSPHSDYGYLLKKKYNSNH